MLYESHEKSDVCVPTPEAKQAAIMSAAAPSTTATAKRRPPAAPQAMMPSSRRGEHGYRGQRYFGEALTRKI